MLWHQRAVVRTAAASPTRTGRSLSQSSTMMSTPPHALSLFVEPVGVREAGTDEPQAGDADGGVGVVTMRYLFLYQTRAGHLA